MRKFLFLLMILIGLLSCKDEYQDSSILPAVSQSGKNTGGALVDGKVWVAKKEYIGKYMGGLINMYEYVNNEYKAQVYLSALNGSGMISINLTSRTDFDTNTVYTLDNAKSNYAVYGSSSHNAYFTDSINVGTFKFTKFDKVKRIFSGTFQFKARNFDGKLVNVSEGRFDKRFSN